jgi:hypothetical protein
MDTYVVKIVMDRLESGKQNLSLPEAMRLVADEMAAKNTAKRSLTVYTAMGFVLFAATYDGTQWVLA